MTVRIVCVALPARPVTLGPDVRGQYLKDYDPEAYGGRGLAGWTADRAAAMTFATHKEALECWAQIPANCPLRPDGQPNRPLTSFTVEVESE